MNQPTTATATPVSVRARRLFVEFIFYLLKKLFLFVTYKPIILQRGDLHSDKCHICHMTFVTSALLL